MELRVILRAEDRRSHPELGADSGLASGCAHLQGLVSTSAPDAFKEVVDEIEPAGKQQYRAQL